LFQWTIVATGSQHLEEIYKAPETVLSSMDAVIDVRVLSPMAFVRLLTHMQGLQTDYTLGPNITENPYHVSIVRSQLTQALPLLVPEVYDEVVMACNEFIPITQGKCESPEHV
jgi:hypothetical protein